MARPFDDLSERLLRGVAVPRRVQRCLGVLLAAALLEADCIADTAPRPVVYNELSGDGGVEVDRSIKQAYAQRYTIRDTSRADGYVEPEATSGDLPTTATDDKGAALGGYVLVVYIVSAEGRVTDPVVVRSNDPRLSRIALDAMAKWRFSPGMLKGQAVATTGAQEFNFGPLDISNGYRLARIAVYQPNDILVNRMPPAEDLSAYVARLVAVAHNFFVGSTMPETFHIVTVTRPGSRVRIWFASSERPGDSKELEPLRKLLEAVPPLFVRKGPVILSLSGLIAGGDEKEPMRGKDYRPPVPSEWKAIAARLPQPIPVSSDQFLDLVWPDGK